MTPIIYEKPEDTGIHQGTDPDKFGLLGDIYAITFHHSAGPRATSKARAQVLHHAYQQDHENKGWGDIGYHFSMDDQGRIYRLRDIEYKGAHVGEHNTGNVGFMVHGNYMVDHLKPRQKETLKWLFRGGFYELFGERERDIALVRGHREWPGHNSNQCPGVNLMRYIAYLRSKEFHNA